jgi:hypothetical protein
VKGKIAVAQPLVFDEEGLEEGDDEDASIPDKDEVVAAAAGGGDETRL